MLGLVPSIHVFVSTALAVAPLLPQRVTLLAWPGWWRGNRASEKDVDGRQKAGHDDWGKSKARLKTRGE